MKMRHKRLLSDLNKIATHFKLKLSKIDVVKTTAFALDSSKKKLLIIDEDDWPFFKTMDLRNVNTCDVKFDYSGLDSGDLRMERADQSIDKVQLQISHVDPEKSVDIEFYNAKENNISQLKLLVEMATSWRDSIAARLPISA